jgi:hypothetical protein
MPSAATCFAAADASARLRWPEANGRQKSQSGSPGCTDRILSVSRVNAVCPIASANQEPAGGVQPCRCGDPQSRKRSSSLIIISVLAPQRAHAALTEMIGCRGSAPRFVRQSPGTAEQLNRWLIARGRA